MVTRLRCSNKVDITDEQAVVWGNRLHNLYFGANTNMKFDDLTRSFRTMSKTTDKKRAEKAKKKKDGPRGHYRRQRGDQVMVALIYFLEGVLFSSDAKRNVSSLHMKMMDDLDTCISLGARGV